MECGDRQLVVGSEISDWKFKLQKCFFTECYNYSALITMGILKAVETGIPRLLAGYILGKESILSLSQFSIFGNWLVTVLSIAEIESISGFPVLVTSPPAAAVPDKRRRFWRLQFQNNFLQQPIPFPAGILQKPGIRRLLSS